MANGQQRRFTLRRRVPEDRKCKRVVHYCCFSHHTQLLTVEACEHRNIRLDWAWLTTTPAQVETKWKLDIGNRGVRVTSGVMTWPDPRDRDLLFLDWQFLAVENILGMERVILTRCECRVYEKGRETGRGICATIYSLAGGPHKQEITGCEWLNEAFEIIPVILPDMSAILFCSSCSPPPAVSLSATVL